MRKVTTYRLFMNSDEGNLEAVAWIQTLQPGYSIHISHHGSVNDIDLHQAKMFAVFISREE